MRKLAIVLAATVSLSTFSGCGGPYYLGNSASDWYAEHYGDSPWLYGNVVSNWVYNFVQHIFWFCDVVALNTYYFWFKDAQPGGDGKGTVYEHKALTKGKKLK
jgi:hypothetical protein